MLRELSDGQWQTPVEGVGLEPPETVTSMLSCVMTAASLRHAVVNAVQLRRDTDAVAALVSGLLGRQLRVEQAQAALPWHQAAQLPESNDEVRDVAEALAVTNAVRSV